MFSILIIFSCTAFALAHPRIKGVNWINQALYPGAETPLIRTSSNEKLKYYGGPVIENVEIHPLFWGDAKYKQQLENFYHQVSTSTWLGALTEYSTPDSTIGYGSSFPSLSPPVAKTSGQVTDLDDIQPWLVDLVKSGAIYPNNNTYYPIHFAPGVGITMQGSHSCQAFCAYHGTIDISSFSNTKYLYYGVMPDLGGLCRVGCGISFKVFDNLCSVASHELGEAITDAAVGDELANPLAWYNDPQGENGDICNGNQGSFVGTDGITYKVQKLWSNAQRACVVNGPQPKL